MLQFAAKVFDYFEARPVLRFDRLLWGLLRNRPSRARIQVFDLEDGPNEAGRFRPLAGPLFVQSMIELCIRPAASAGR